MSNEPSPEEIADQMDGFEGESAGETPPDEGMAGPESPGPEGSYQPRTTAGQLMQALQSTEPNEPLETIESPFDPSNGGERRIFRGIKKMTHTEGQPAWLDLMIGMFEVLIRERFGLGDANASNEQASDQDQDADQDEQRALSPDERLQQFNQRRND